MGHPDRIQFFVTSPHECSYIDGQEATAIFADPYSSITSSTFSTLTEMGFRRSGDYVYKPRCEACQACVPLRVPVHDFKPSRSQKRVIRKNKHLRIEDATAEFRAEDYELYEHYINSKHSDGGMHPPTQDQYQSFLMCQWTTSRFFRFFQGDQLVGVAVVDCLDHGYSAVYTFYDTHFSKQSLGTFIILWQIEYCKTQKLPFLYLGYLVKACEKMAYKDQFQPLEALINDQWVLQKPPQI